MVYPTKKDIDEAIESLSINVDVCSEWGVPINAKRVGGVIQLAESSKHITKDEAKYYHDKSNELIRKFKDTCSCTHK